MTTPFDPMRITPIGRAAVATVAFGSGGQLRVTAIVKATFALVPDGPMAPLAPLPVVRSDEPSLGQVSRSLTAAAETAPYLARTDVVVIGNAHAPFGRPAPRLPARLLIARDGRPILDKTLWVQGSKDASGAHAPIATQPLVYEAAVGGPGFPDNPVGTRDPAQVRVFHPQHPGRPAGFGPVARSWPVRRQLLGSFDPWHLNQRIAILPDGFPWGYFQAAPPDQRIGALRGDEWFVLEGFHADRPRLQSQLPNAAGAARLYGSTGDLVSGLPIAMVADMAILDAERRTCSIVWRGSFPIANEEALGALEIHAGVVMPGQPIAFPTSRVAAASLYGDHPLGSTVGVDPESSERWKNNTLPFHPVQSPAGGPPEEATSRGAAGRQKRPKATVALSAEDLARQSAAPMMPFVGAPPAAEPAARSFSLPPATPFDRAAFRAEPEPQPVAAPGSPWARPGGEEAPEPAYLPTPSGSSNPPAMVPMSASPAPAQNYGSPGVLPASALHHHTAPAAVEPFEAPPPLDITYAGEERETGDPSEASEASEEPVSAGPLGAPFLAAAARAGLTLARDEREDAGSA